jgi:hypothetical protein
MKWSRSYAAEVTEDMARNMKEVGSNGLQEKVRRLVKQLRAHLHWGMRYYHTHDSRYSPKGFPDVMILFQGGRVVVAELKCEKTKPSQEQREWLDLFLESGAEVYLWRPSHLLSGEIHRILVAGPSDEDTCRWEDVR